VTGIDQCVDGKVITTVTVIKSKPEKMASRWRQGWLAVRVVKTHKKPRWQNQSCTAT